MKASAAGQLPGRVRGRTGPLSVRAVTALVLLVNEAAINACKHVFRPRRGTRFSVRLHEGEDGIVDLATRDDGPGFPPAVLGGALQWLDGPGAGLSVAFRPR
ncbi:hypothetical protein [Falsiroseomonas sp. HW251]|uniref:hypothetical protein n=1 Tax=Falsiroseomonas sp. HW251 TaxID=3390998 RepID=UPI003D31448E